METLKYKLTDEVKKVFGHEVHRIVSITDFGDVHCGDKGGFVESYDNLSHWHNCWVSGDAVVFGQATVRGGAIVRGTATVAESALMSQGYTQEFI